MNEDFVDFSLAKKLKEKGFPQRVFGAYEMCGAAYFNDGRFYRDGCICNTDKAYTAPTISQVLKWMREEKKFYVVPLIYSDWSEDEDGIICEEWLFWSYRVININDGSIVYDELGKIDNGNFENYEQSALAGIEYVIKNLI